MRWRSFVLLTFALAAVSASAARPGPPAGSADTARDCLAPAARITFNRFVAAFNSGDQRRLDRLIAPKRRFRRYEVYGPVGWRRGANARRRSTLSGYLSERHRHSERLVLTWFSFTRSTSGGASFRFDVVRSADDLLPPTLYRGSGAIDCSGQHQLVAWMLAPSTEPSLPAPQTYSDTCRLVSAWCELEPSTRAIPAELRRPLAFPTVLPGSYCPATAAGTQVSNGFFGGFALGEGPVQPIVTGHRVQVFRPRGGRGWYGLKTLWFARPEYQGPVLIRGRQLDGPHEVVFGEGPSLIDPQLGYGSPLNSKDGWRTWPGATWLRTPGCYAWQIDGTDFSTVIVFEALFARAH